MRLAILAALIAAPVVADETPLLERDCMEVVGTIAYGPETFGSGVLVGVAIGYGMAHGMQDAETRGISKKVARICRNTPGMTFGEALNAVHQD